MTVSEHFVFGKWLLSLLYSCTFRQHVLHMFQRHSMESFKALRNMLYKWRSHVLRQPYSGTSKDPRHPERNRSCLVPYLVRSPKSDRLYIIVSNDCEEYHQKQIHSYIQGNIIQAYKELTVILSDVHHTKSNP